MSDSMRDGDVDGLYKLAMANIKMAYVTAQEAQQGLQPQQVDPATGQPVDPATAAQMQGQPPMDPAMAGGQPPADPAMAQGGQPMPQAAPDPASTTQSEAPSPVQQAGAAPTIDHDMVVNAVRQVMQEMGTQGQSGAQAPQAGQAQAGGEAPKKKGTKGGVDPDDFAKLQAAVYAMMEQMGMVNPQDTVAGLVPPPQDAGAEGAQKGNGMGADPGQAAGLPEDAVPIGPMDPNAAAAMANAGAQGRRMSRGVGKVAALASLLRGDS